MRTASPGQQLRLKRTIEVLHASDGASYLLRGGADAEFVIEDSTPDERAVLDALAGGGATSLAGLSEAVAARGGTATEHDLTAALADLDDLGLLEEPGGAAADLLGDEDAERFDRQLAYFADQRPGESAQLQRRLRDARVAIVGVGGLGTWTASALACAGIGHLTLIDDDVVALSNLNRQVLFRREDVGRPKVEAAAEAIAAFDPELHIATHATRITGPRKAAQLLDGHDFVIELADWPPYDLGRWLEQACWPLGISRTSAALFPPSVRLGPTYVPGVTPCLACQEAAARAAFPLYDELADLRRTAPTVSPTLGPPCALIGGVLAMDVVHHLTGIAAPATLGAALIVDLRDLTVEREPLTAQEGCERCRAA
jgi:molybdopterin-synthase adenylyltransferase